MDPRSFATIVAENETELARLRALISRLSDSDLKRPLTEGWTVSAALAHIAFWDQRCIILLDRWEHEPVADSPADGDPINDALLPLTLAIPPRDAAALAIQATEELHRRIAALPAERAALLLSMPESIWLPRSDHWAAHAEQIEAAIAA